ncbi:hypothetical protein L917_13347 [Phytophthora nicotianae]|uniref:Uncharacterized protein n=2 Tax=Phytophthora nicotianae TaxID=4792 RepID=W2PBG8_PHYN3|nr:hypothetical protein PPTG_25008 [Phytophthora nicotianae INRA-310]ETL87480.1 hypothetical protein L917_13347 [Phytophthora nicotianae]ETM97319.1 hypothetical protein PPTG_25008 [Phytophthora nicotianae INRA-310]
MLNPGTHVASLATMISTATPSASNKPVQTLYAS